MLSSGYGYAASGIQPRPIPLIDGLDKSPPLPQPKNNRIAKPLSQLGIGCVAGLGFLPLPRQYQILGPNDRIKRKRGWWCLLGDLVTHPLRVYAGDDRLIACGPPFSNRVSFDCLDRARRGIFAVNLHPNVAPALPLAPKALAQFWVEAQEAFKLLIVIEVDGAKPARRGTKKDADVPADVEFFQVTKVAHLLNREFLPALQERPFLALGEREKNGVHPQ